VQLWHTDGHVVEVVAVAAALLWSCPVQSVAQPQPSNTPLVAEKNPALVEVEGQKAKALGASQAMEKTVAEDDREAEHQEEGHEVLLLLPLPLLLPLLQMQQLHHGCMGMASEPSQEAEETAPCKMQDRAKALEEEKLMREEHLNEDPQVSELQIQSADYHSTHWERRLVNQAQQVLYHPEKLGALVDLRVE